MHCHRPGVVSRVLWCFSTSGLVHQGSRIDEQRCEFPLPLKVPLTLKICTRALILFIFELLSLPSEAHVSVVVSGFDIRRRPATCSPIGVGGLLDRPPLGEAGGCESHFLPWPPSRALRYHGAGRRGQDLPHVLPLACESHSQRNTLFVLYRCVHSVLCPSSTITRSQRQILAWGLWFYPCVWRRRRTGCG